MVKGHSLWTSMTNLVSHAPSLRTAKWLSCKELFSQRTTKLSLCRCTHGDSIENAIQDQTKISNCVEIINCHKIQFPSRDHVKEIKQNKMIKQELNPIQCSCSSVSCNFKMPALRNKNSIQHLNDVEVIIPKIANSQTHSYHPIKTIIYCVVCPEIGASTALETNKQLGKHYNLV